MSKVGINGRSVVHKGDGQVNTCAVPDVCKTPSPGGPVPIPYVNVAQDSDLAKGSRSVNIEGNPVALKDSNLSTSSGDEPGTAGGGIISSKTKGKMTWANSSIDVKIEGKGVVRFMEPTQHNGNTSNTAFLQNGQTLIAYGDDFVPDTKCNYCSRLLSTHRVHEHKRKSKGRAQDLAKELDRVHAQGLPMFKKGGYMIGVLVCECGDVVIAAMSGAPTPAAFHTAVAGLGWRSAQDLRTQASQSDPSKLLRNLRNGRGELLPQFIDSLDIAHTAIPDEISERAQRMPFGICAAPKLIAAMQQLGHKPHYLTEQWYLPPNSKAKRTTVSIKYSKTTYDVTKIVREEFKPGDTVPSCETCQITLPALLCYTPKRCSGARNSLPPRIMLSRSRLK
jgi:hypothetical protein